MRKILLLEQGYKNKYPPLGLMKIATYHRMLGDDVTFFKGDPRDLILKKIVSDCLVKLNAIGEGKDWSDQIGLIESFIKTGKKTILESILGENIAISQSSRLWLKHFSQYFRQNEFGKYPEYDRIYVTTLFTFYWNISIKTIQNAKHLVKDLNELKIGGVMASLLPGEIESATGIVPMTGLLDVAGALDDNNIVVDDLPLDYSILDEVDYTYPTGSAYFTFMTKGCTRTCSFCSVPKLEPTYKEKIPTVDKFHKIKTLFGEQRNLLLMDNNVLASPRFPEIIQEIKDMGFTKDALYLEPNQLDIAVRNLRANINDAAYVKRITLILEHFRAKSVKGKSLEVFENMLRENGLSDLSQISKENILLAYDEIKEFYEKHRDKTPKKRYVDFNQGTDSRYVTEENMRLLSEIPINPLRIAFDHIGLKDIYENAVRLAAEYGINRLSNYLLFNFNDKPEDLYNRMKINIDLSEELDIQIYSFPMKYIPLFGEEAKHRKYIGKHWNKKFIRVIQAVSNATRGIVPAGRSFFERAFGASVDEFNELLFMPEAYIINRKLFDEDLGYTSDWRELFSGNHLNEEEKTEAMRIISVGDFSDLSALTTNKRILQLLEHYTVRKEDLSEDEERVRTKRAFDQLIHDDQFLELTLTYDYDEQVIREVAHV
ncbi:MAG: hypothetical protein IPN69_21150 [Acidobacteria bacterium]|nr:hypothetical protein [Acidobacteriota bacterium]